jgi:tRNA dimethylallyltransferase
MTVANAPKGQAEARPGVIVLAGPTAVGKSAVALQLAGILGGEIVSADSMQVYRGLGIGTAKPSAAERARVPHHLIDVAELAETFDAARFCQLAREAVADCRQRGRVAILCGGTGFYLTAFLEGLGEAPKGDPALRARLAATPLSELLRELERRDPVTYRRIDRRNLRRVVRAVEVIRLTGRPFSAQQARRSPGAAAERVPCFGLTREAEDLRSRINARVDDMFRRGLVAETRALLAEGLGENKTAMQAIGYRQVVEHLQGRLLLPETIELVKVRTRQFARRQMTWFRRKLRLDWLEIPAGELPLQTADRLLARLGYARAPFHEAKTC